MRSARAVRGAARRGGGLLLLLGCSAAQAQYGGGYAAADSSYGATPEAFVPYRQTESVYWRFFESPQEFRGPGREKAPPADLQSVKIGMMAPLTARYDAAIGEAMVRGATLAVEEANQRGGFRGELPFELLVRDDSGPWGATSNTLVELAYEEKVWAVVGSLDGAATHVALRVALKAEIPLVNTASTDPTVNETAIPWLICCYPDARQYGYRLARLIFEEQGHRRVAVFRSNSRYGRMGIGEFTDAARRLGAPLVLEVRHNPGERAFDAQIERIRKLEAEALVVWSDAEDAGAIVAALRAAGIEAPIYGPDRLLAARFFAAAGAAAEGVRAVCPLDPGSDDARWTEFQRGFRERFGAAPDAFAAFSYDGLRLLLEALGRSGLNRALLRDELAALKRFEGVAGPMRFDATHNNLGTIHVLRARGGRFVAAER